MTTYTLRQGSPDRSRADLVVIGVGTSSKGALVTAAGGEPLAAAHGRGFASLLTSLGFSGGAGESTRLPAGAGINAPQVLVVGLGPLAGAPAPSTLRRAAGVAARGLGNVSSVSVALPAEDPEQVRAVVEGFALGLYSYRAYKSGPRAAEVAEVAFLSPAARRQDAKDALARALELASATARARDWVNTPPNELTPQAFAESIASATRGVKGLRAEVLDEAALRELGCGGILAVGGGSTHSPYLVKLVWEPPTAERRMALVGKGVTYDSGGLTIKPGASMPRMKSDMGGAAAVVAAIIAMAQREVPVAVTAWVPLAENAISGTAMRPGDVITTRSGQTVEIRNTDGEGRLVLADALSLAVEEEPDSIVEISTLTAHVSTALGPRVAGLFGDDTILEAVRAAADRAGEMVWPLPIPDEARRAVRNDSQIADLLQHNWVRWGGGLYAAAFLEVFVADRPWAHLDIAGPAWNAAAPWGHVPSGGTGFGVATLVEYVASLG